MKFSLLLWLALAPIFLFGQDGVLDPSFGDNGVVITDLNDGRDFGHALIEQPDGKLVVAGNRVALDFSTVDAVLIRYLSDGGLDLSFGVNGIVIADLSTGFDEYTDLFIRSDGKILVGGRKDQSPAYTYFVACYLADGTVDSSFGLNGFIEVPEYSVLQLLDDDKFMLIRSNNTTITLSQYLADGSVDTNFGVNGDSIITVPYTNFRVQNVKLLNNGNITLVAIKETSSQVILMQFLPDGSLDPSFGTNGTANYIFNPSHIHNAAYFDITPNGSIVIAGATGNCESISQSFLMRFNPNGGLDQSFGNGGVLLTAEIDSTPFGVVVQGNNRILVPQNWADCVEWFYFYMERYYSDGSIDNTFANTNTAGLEPNGIDLILQDDGKIVALGRTPWFSGDGDIVLYRYSNDPLGVDENTLQTASVYPNPSTGTFVLELPNLTKSTAYSILDVSGKRIQSGWLHDVSTTLDISEVQSGLYFLKVESTTLQLIKE